MEAAGRRWIEHPSRTDEFTIWNLSDIHLGSRATAEDRLREDVETIRQDPRSFWFGGGDMAEYISYSDRRRFDPDAFAPWVKVADLGNLGQVLTEKVRDTLKPIAHKCLGLIFGNHEHQYAREKEQMGLHGWLCKELGAENLGYTAFVDVQFRKKPGGIKLVRVAPGTQPWPVASFRFFLHHGAGAAQTPGGRITRLARFMSDFDADCYMVGHVHGRTGERVVRIGADAKCGKIVARETIGVISGSYLKTYAQGVHTYGERAAYRPAALGAAFIRIRPETREMRAEI